MKAIILAAGYATRMYPLTFNRAKALLPFGEMKVIDYIFDGQLNRIEEVNAVYVVSNNKFYGDFAEWARGVNSAAPVTVLNDGTEADGAKRGAIGDIRFVIDEMKIDEDILVICGDNYFTYDLKKQYEFFRAKGHDTLTAGIVNDTEQLKQFAVAVLDKHGKVLSITEKPEKPESNIAVYGTYFYKKETVALFKEYLDGGNNPDQPGRFPVWLHTRRDVYAYIMEDGDCYDIGTIKTYEEMKKRVR